MSRETIVSIQMPARAPKTRLRLFSATIIPLAIAFLLCGCATHRKFAGSRPFNFQTDTFAYANQLIWVYNYDEQGKWVHHRREPPPDYAQHCFVVIRSARQFFENARFDPTLPMTNDVTYRSLIHRIISVDPERALPESDKIVIPGYANLREFSKAREPLLKAECGGAWHSYFQRGHWRMIFPFSRKSQKQTAEELLADLQESRPPIVHLVRFPQLTINHAVLVFDAKEQEDRIGFSVYDPNDPDKPKELTFDRAQERFVFPASNYWPGGRLDVYEIYRSFLF